jgi:Domain of unknown function (DUF4214)
MLVERLFSLAHRLVRPNATTSSRNVRLRLETLENRLTPSVAANDLFVTSLYQGVLGRNPDATGLAYWTGQLSAGATRTQVAAGITRSSEGLSRDIQIFYQDLLNRPADQTGLTYWFDQTQYGMSLNQVEAGIIGSQEFFNDAGGTNTGFINAMYQSVLGQPADATAQSFWGNLLNEGNSRIQVAGQLLVGTGDSQLKVTDFYQELLARAPDTTGLQYWAAQLESGTPQLQVLAGILGSDEYFTRVQNTGANTGLTDPNQVSTQMLASAKLFSASLPGSLFLNQQMTSNLPTPPLPPPLPSPTTSSGTTVSNGNTFLQQFGVSEASFADAIFILDGAAFTSGAPGATGGSTTTPTLGFSSGAPNVFNTGTSTPVTAMAPVTTAPLASSENLANLNNVSPGS